MGWLDWTTGFFIWSLNIVILGKMNHTRKIELVPQVFFDPVSIRHVSTCLKFQTYSRGTGQSIAAFRLYSAPKT